MLSFLIIHGLTKARGLFSRSSCLTEHKTGSSGCTGSCRSCWNLCQKFSELHRGVATPDCDDIGCVTARDAIFGRDDKDRNRVRLGARKPKKRPEIEFTEKPEFDSELCVLRWTSPVGNQNAINFRFRAATPTPDIVYIVFGKDFQDRWYELGQTSLPEMSVSVETSAKLSEIRLMGVASFGVVDETSVTVQECWQASSEAASSLSLR